jgi:purine-binding chemotaxis protein CheW
MRPARLQANETALESAGGADRMRAVLRARAAALANEQSRHPLAPGVPALICRLGPDRYAIELRSLAEVLPRTKCIAVPGGRPEFLGIFNLRGELRPVVDLARVLGYPSDGAGEFVLISHRQVGLRVDGIDGVREIRREELTRPTQSRYHLGLAPGNIVLLDIEALLSGVVGQKEPRTSC